MSWQPPKLRPDRPAVLEPLEWESIPNPTTEVRLELLGSCVWIPWPLRGQESAAVLGRVVRVSQGYGKTILHVEPEGGRGTVRVSRWKRAPPGG